MTKPQEIRSLYEKSVRIHSWQNYAGYKMILYKGHKMILYKGDKMILYNGDRFLRYSTLSE